MSWVANGMFEDASEADLLGDADTGVTAGETDAVDSRVLGQEVSNLRPLACTRQILSQHA